MEDQTNGKEIKAIPPKERVIITVYVESPRKQSNKSHQNPISINKNSHPNAHPKAPKSRGYDRRAELLAYSRELRNVDSATTHLPKTKSKWRVKSETAAVRRLPSRRGLRQGRYERVGMMREERTEVVEQRCLPKCFNGDYKRSSGRLGSSILRKLKSLMGGLSKGCKRGGW
ncbi:hypothetical protein SDJN02_06812, partial [Cucurbita argyrosperma subsp. argyrosperma]